MSNILQQVITCDFKDGRKFNYGMDSTAQYRVTAFGCHILFSQKVTVRSICKGKILFKNDIIRHLLPITYFPIPFPLKLSSLFSYLRQIMTWYIFSLLVVINGCEQRAKEPGVLVFIIELKRTKIIIFVFIFFYKVIYFY